MRFYSIFFTILFLSVPVLGKSFILQNGITVTFEKDTNALVRLSYLEPKTTNLFEKQKTYISFTFDGEKIQVYYPSQEKPDFRAVSNMLVKLLKKLDNSFDPKDKNAIFGQTAFAEKLYNRLENTPKKP